MHIHSIADVAEFIGKFPAETDNLRRMIVSATRARAISLDFASDPDHADYQAACRTLEAFDAASVALAQEIGGDDDFTEALVILCNAIGDHVPDEPEMSPREEALASLGDDDAKLYGTRAA